MKKKAHFIKVNTKRMYYEDYITKNKGECQKNIQQKRMSQKLLFIKDNRGMYCKDGITKGSLHNTKRIYYEYDVTMSSAHKASLKRMYYKDDVMKACLHK